MYNKYVKHCKKCNKQYETNDSRSRSCDGCNMTLQQLKIEQLPRKECKECGVEFRRKIGIYCSRECKDEAQKTGRYEKCIMCRRYVWNIDTKKRKCCSVESRAKWRVLNYSSNRLIPCKKKKKRIYEKFEYTCGYCKKVKHEKMIPLQIHHIDDNPMHTVIDNLVPLCLSCHMKTKYPHLYSYNGIDIQKILNS